MDTEEKIKYFFENEGMVELYKTQSDYNLFSRRRVVLDMLRDTHFSQVVDLGCGSGGYLCIRKQYNCVYHGIDFSENMIKTAKERAKELDIEDGVFFEIADVRNTQFTNDSSFDLALAMGLIEYFERPNELIHEVKRILKKGGVLIIESFMPNPYVLCLYPLLTRIKSLITGNKIKHKKYTKRQLDSLMVRNGFQLADFAYSNFHILPTPFNIFFPKIQARISEYLTRKNAKRFRFFAVDYVGKYYLTDK